MSNNINYIKYINFFCTCKKTNANNIKIIKNKSQETIIDIKDFLKHENFKKFLEYGKELLEILNYRWFQKIIISDENENEKIINSFIKICNDIGFVCSNNINFNEHNSLILDIRKIKKISYKIVRLYMLYELYMKTSVKKLLQYQFESFKDFIKSLSINTEIKYKKEWVHYTLYGYNIEHDLVKVIKKDFNKHSKYIQIEVTKENMLVLSSYDLYALGLYTMLDNYLDNCLDNATKNNKKIFICPKCKRKINLTNNRIRNIKLCNNCRKEDTKRKNIEYYKKKKLINELKEYNEKVCNIDNFDMIEYNIYINSISNKKKGVKKKNLKEIENYIDKVRKAISNKD